MASSVSSERAFSAAGITIRKCCNCLKGDVVKALECMKCLLHCDLLFHEVVSTKDLEGDLESEVIVDGDPDHFIEVVADAELLMGSDSYR